MTMKPTIRVRSVPLAALLALVVSVVGCQQLRSPDGRKAGAGSTVAPPVHLPSNSESAAADGKLTHAQEADLQIAFAKSAERRGDLDNARDGYEDALKRDPKRADACLRLAILNDQQGKFTESSKWFREALKLKPGDPDVFCNMGYSLYLQKRWSEAEMNLRQALAVNPGHQRAHNNLGLVLANTGRSNDALAEFHKGGCREAQAHNNLAFVLTENRQWAEARAQYRLALAADPSATATVDRLKELDSLVAKVNHAKSRMINDENVKLTSATVSNASNPKSTPSLSNSAGSSPIAPR